jgi:hypothetical protein
MTPPSTVRDTAATTTDVARDDTRNVGARIQQLSPDNITPGPNQGRRPCPLETCLSPPFALFGQPAAKRTGDERHHDPCQNRHVCHRVQRHQGPQWNVGSDRLPDSSDYK